MVAGLIVIGTFVVASVGILRLGASNIDLPDVEKPSTWAVLVGPLFRVFFVALGWAWGLMLFPKSEDVLNVRART